MADNTTLNLGSGGDVIATDDIGGIKFQRVKIVLGGDGVNDGDVSSINPIPTTPAQNAVTVTSRSGTTSATINTSTTLMTANTSRKGFLIQNLHASASIFINELGSAATTTQPSIEIKAGTTFQYPAGITVTAAITVISGTASVPFSAREW